MRSLQKCLSAVPPHLWRLHSLSICWSTSVCCLAAGQLVCWASAGMGSKAGCSWRCQDQAMPANQPRVTLSCVLPAHHARKLPKGWCVLVQLRPAAGFHFAIAAIDLLARRWAQLHRQGFLACCWCRQDPCEPPADRFCQGYGHLPRSAGNILGADAVHSCVGGRVILLARRCSSQATRRPLYASPGRYVCPRRPFSAFACWSSCSSDCQPSFSLLRPSWGSLRNTPTVQQSSATW